MLHRQNRAPIYGLRKARSVRWKIFTFHTGQLSGKPVVLVKSGVGKVFAAMIDSSAEPCGTSPGKPPQPLSNPGRALNLLSLKVDKKRE